MEPLARELRERVHRRVAIPTCVGIAPTKTLAKVANFIAKKRPQYRGVCDLRSSQVRAELLSTVPVDEVWGSGAASAAKLAKIGVQTAADLAALEPENARALMTVTGGRTVYELRTGTIWNVGTLDEGGDLKTLIENLYPNVQQPYRALESLMNSGFSLLADEMKSDGGLRVEEVLGRSVEAAKAH